MGNEMDTSAEALLIEKRFNEWHEDFIREYMAKRGYRLMHRRNGQYWVMFANPMTLDEIQAQIANERKRTKPSKSSLTARARQ